MDNQIYKIFQVMEFFITKYSYVSVQIKNLVKPEEAFIVSPDNKQYPLIRISTTPVLNSKYDKERIDKIVEVLSAQFVLDSSKVLDIHVGNDKVNNDEPYKTISINSNYYSGDNLENIYPGIHNIIVETSNEEEALKKSIDNINSAVRSFREKAKNRPLYKKMKDAKCPVTFIVMTVCIILFILTLILEYKGGYTASASLIALGANYKMFTLGLKQFYRLFTGAFLHSSFMHIFFNLWSFYVVSSVIERNLGTIKYLVMLIVGILFSSLTAGILGGNSLVIGLSGGIYCLFVYLISYYIGSGYINTRTFLPTIILNLALNFLPGVSWQTHLGGAICGIMFYYIYKDKKIDYKLCAVILILMVGLSYKYVKDYNLTPYYQGTDTEVLKIYYDLGLKDYSLNKLNDLLKIYNG